MYAKKGIFVATSMYQMDVDFAIGVEVGDEKSGFSYVHTYVCILPFFLDNVLAQPNSLAIKPCLPCSVPIISNSRSQKEELRSRGFFNKIHLQFF
jgi:non-canonical (house-cleaning) NTP pyrophosphatase